MSKYDALYTVPLVLLDQAHHAHIRFDGEHFVIDGHSESDRLLFTVTGMPSVAYAVAHCRYGDVPVRAEEVDG